MFTPWLPLFNNKQQGSSLHVLTAHLNYNSMQAPPWLPPDGSSQLLRVCNEVIALQTAPQAIEPQEIAQQLVTQQPEPHQPGWLSRLVGIVCAVLLRPLQPGAP